MFDYRKIPAVIQNLKCGFIFGIRKLTTSEGYRLIKKNSKFKDMYQGQRCFIIANGPSLNSENLQLLKNEKIITVNQMIRKKEIVDLKPIVNVWADLVYFSESMPNESQKEFEDIFKNTCSLKGLRVFVPLYSYDYLKRRNLALDNVYYMDYGLELYNGYRKKIDFTKPVPSMQNIVQYAIEIAVYMGFKEIYLLGCDSTGILTKIESVTQRQVNNYSYELDEKSTKYINSLLDFFTVEEQFAGWTRTFHLYKKLFTYCHQKNIKLINCSKLTIIEGIPRMPLEKVVIK